MLIVATGIYRADNHGWLFGWSNGYVFQAGPSVAMNWYGTDNGGSQVSAGSRTGDTDAMCGNAAMYDAVAGNILTVGGAIDYQNADATSNAHIITMGQPTNISHVQTIPNMAYQRSFANSVILPDGTVLIVGGQVTAQPFSDATAQLTPELFNPVTNTFRQLAAMAIPRTYHSTALLMPDATVMSGGGGLCGACATNHYDAQFFNPPYLYTATGALAARPVINSVSVGTINVGGTFTVNTDSAIATGFSLIRISSTTHTVNTDQRRIPLVPSGTNGFTYTLTVPSDPGVALPGAWMLFAINGAGVPSVSKVLTITL
jgi:galactose oxidase